MAESVQLWLNRHDDNIFPVILSEPQANREDLKLQDFVEQHVFPGQIEDYGNRFEMDVEAFEAFNIPPPAYPRQLPSLLLRNVIHRPLLRLLSHKENPTAPPLPPPQQNEAPLHRAA